MRRLLIFVYGVLSYAVFFATFLYAIGFIGNLWVATSIDSAPEVSLMTALLTNLALLGLFAVHHNCRRSGKAGSHILTQVTHPGC